MRTPEPEGTVTFTAIVLEYPAFEIVTRNGPPLAVGKYQLPSLAEVVEREPVVIEAPPINAPFTREVTRPYSPVFVALHETRIPSSGLNT